MKSKTCESVIKLRKSTRSFSNEEISMNDIFEIIDAGRLAPSAKNRQPWSFYILADNEKSQVVKMLENHLSKDNSEATGLASANIMRQANKAVLVFMDDEREYDKVTDLLSVGACIENMLLRATELEISSLWVYDICVIADKLKELANAKGKLVSAVLFGKEDVSHKRAVKKEMKDIILNKNI